MNTPTGEETRDKFNLTLLNSVALPSRERAEANGQSLSQVVERLLATELAKGAPDNPAALLAQASTLIDSALRILRRGGAQVTADFAAEGANHLPRRSGKKK